MAPRRYSAACSEDGTLLLVRTCLLDNALSPRISFISRLSGGHARCAGSASGGSSPADTSPGTRRVSLYFKLRSAALAVHAPAAAQPLVRALVLQLVAADDTAMRISIRIGRRHSTCASASDLSDVTGARYALRRSVWTVEAEDEDDFARWRAAFAAAARTSFPMHYKRGRCIGRGHFSNVYLATDKLTGELFVVKIVQGDSKRPEKTRKYVRREVKVLSIADHENLVRAYDFFSHAGKPHLVLEYIPNGSLQDLVTKRHRLSEDQARPVMAGILRGVAYLHSRGIIHRDLKPDNVLMVTTTHPKICDFGLSTFIREDTPLVRSVVGTPAYSSPELCAGMPYGLPVDMWACGVVLYYMLSGQRPFCGDSRSALKVAIMRGTLEFPSASFRFVGAKAKHLITSLLMCDQALRLTAEQALEHAWFCE